MPWLTTGGWMRLVGENVDRKRDEARMRVSIIFL